MINYPDINPVAISIPFSGFWGNSIDIHWYALAYVVGAYLIYFHMLSTRKKFGINLDNEKVSDLVITYGLFFGAVIGGRLGHVLFYDFHLQLQDPIYFLKIWEGGMSFHGGLIGVMVAIYFFAKSNGYKFFQISDWLCVSVPIALFLGRIANFINAELYGRPTDISWGMIFPSDPDQLVRHPSQIYEAILEGFLLFLILLNKRLYFLKLISRCSGAMIFIESAILFGSFASIASPKFLKLFDAIFFFGKLIS